ncbi:MAG TPA: S-adenosylmethionine:tRNA ribosyltransferase-isomerase [Candidatus Dormibacteraeota bacterium]|nr:S-adenosylmethionine:tRNA ribosyltransferase-isomerase [Candidatus Dormibacteraeota bacterium]
MRHSPAAAAAGVPRPPARRPALRVVSRDPLAEPAGPPLLRAALPAELRGRSRDGGELTVVDRERGTVEHTVFRDIGRHLRSGDLLVVNTSRVLPAAVAARRSDGTAVQLRPAVRRAASWDALAVEPGGAHDPVGLRAGETLILPGGTVAAVEASRPDLPHVWRLRLDGAAALDELLRFGEPIRYSYVPQPVPLEHYQPVYATVPGSAESPSAGRPFTWELLLGLRRAGVGLAPIVLHTGLSSLQDDAADAEHHLAEEWFEVPEETAAAVAAARRVVAVGTTVVRALETAATGDHAVAPSRGWTSLAISPDTRLRAVDAMLTGLHETGASHLSMVEALVDGRLLTRALDEARGLGHLWHEFGDSLLVI